MMNAAAARELAKRNTKEGLLVEQILKEVKKAAEKGEFFTFYYTDDYFAAVRAGRELANLGYKVRSDKGLVGEEYTISIYW